MLQYHQPVHSCCSNAICGSESWLAITYSLGVGSQVNCLLPPSAGEKFGVRGFPTIKWFPRGKADKPEE